MRRALRWTLWGVLGVVGLAVLAVVAVVIVLHTGWGRDLVRRRAQSALLASFPGGARVGRVEGSPFGELVVHDVELDRADHQPEVRIGTLRVQLALSPLVDHVVRIDHLVLDDVVVDLPTAPEPAKEEAPSSGAGWTIELGHLEIHRARVVRGALELDDLEAGGAATLDTATLDASAIASVSARWHGHAVHGALVARYADGAASVPFAAFDAEGARLAIVGVRASAQAASGEVTAAVPATAAAALGAELPGDATLAAWSDGHAIGVDAALGPTQLLARLEADLPARRVAGLVTAIDPAYGTTTLALDASATGVRGIASWSGLDLPGGARPAGALAFGGTADGGWLALGGGTPWATASAAGDAHARLFARVVRTAAGVDLAEARLGATGHLTRGAAGRVEVQAHATGRLWPVPDVQASASLEGTHLADGALGVGAVHVKIEGISLREAGASARARIAIDTVTHGGAMLGAGELSLHATAAPGQPLVVDLDSHRVITTGGAMWTGRGGRLEIAPDHVALAGLRTGSAGASLVANARVARDTGDLTASLAATAVPAALVARGARGTLDLTAQLGRTAGAWSAHAALAGHALAVGHALPPLALDGTFDVHGRRLALTANATSTAGDAGLHLELDGPADLTDADAWQRLSSSALRVATLSIDHVDASQLGGSGLAVGSLQLTAHAASGSIRFDGVHTSAGALDGELALGRTPDGALAFTLDAQLAHLARATGNATLALPAHPFASGAWSRMLVRGVHLAVPEVAFDPGVLARLGAPDLPYRGRFAFDASLGAGIDDAKLHAHVHDLHGGAIAHPVALDVDATLDGEGVKGGLTLRDTQRILVEGSAHAPLALGKVAAMRATPLAGTIAIPSVPVPALLAVFGRSDVTAGTLGGTIDLGGTLGTPTAKASLTANGLTVPSGIPGKPPAVLSQLAIAGRWTGTSGELDVTGTEKNGGTLHLTANGAPRDPTTIAASLDVHEFDIAPLAALGSGPLIAATGTLDGSLALRGLDTSGDVHGELRLRNGRVPITPRMGTLRQAQFDLKIANHQLTGKLSGRIGQGKIDGTAKVAFDGAQPRRASIDLALDKISPIGEIQPQISADVAIRLASGKRWTGDVTVSHGTILVPSEEGNALLDPGAPTDMTFGDANAPPPAKPRVKQPPRHVWLVANVDLQPTSVQADEARGVIAGKLALRVGYTSMGLSGTISALRGDAELFGRSYQLDHAAIIFDGAFDPRLDVRLIHDFDQLELVADVGGRASDPQLDLSSTPSSYTQGQLLSFLLGADPGGDSSTAGKDAAAGVGAAALSTAAGRLLGKVLPVKLDVLSYQTATASESQSIRAGKWLSRALFVAYRAHPEARPDENANEGDVEYYMPRNWLLQGQGGDRGIFGLDLLHRWRW